MKESERTLPQVLKTQTAPYLACNRDARMLQNVLFLCMQKQMCIEIVSTNG